MLLLLVVGCSSRSRRLKAPKVNPATAASQAMAMYDSSGDGSLSGDELEACPGIKAALKTYDIDSDGAVSQDEIEERLTALFARKAALSSLRVRVALNGQALAGAHVRLVPEPYLGDQVKPASGTTRRSGSAPMTVAPDDLPEAQRAYHGVHYGTFKVEITHPDKKIPAKYNTQTTLGYETVVGSRTVEFDLKD